MNTPLRYLSLEFRLRIRDVFISLVSKLVVSSSSNWCTVENTRLFYGTGKHAEYHPGFMAYRYFGTMVSTLNRYTGFAVC